MNGKTMNHSFDVAIATKYGVSEAIFIENLRFWILKNKANKKHFYEGKYWTYNSAKAYAELFPYWSKQQVERIVAKLKDSGLVEIGHFSTNQYDRTNWYSLNEAVLNSQSPCIEFDESSNRTDVNTDTVVSKSPVAFDNFNAFWKSYPRKTNKAFAQKKFNQINPDETLFQTIMVSLSTFPFSKEEQYIPHASTWLNGRRWEDEAPEEQKINKWAGAR